MNSTKKTVVVLQPGYLPWLGFFDQLLKSDIFVLYDDVQFDKHGWRNRNRIKSPQGPFWLTVPVLHKGKGRQKITDVEIDNKIPWAKKHTGSIKLFYAKAPYLKQYLPELEEILGGNWKYLVDLDLALISFVGRILKIERKIIRSSELNISGDKNERLLNFCLNFSANIYLSGTSAHDYLDTELFHKNGIVVQWQNYIHPVYPQQYGEFIPYLSVLDLIFNCGEKSNEIILNQEKRTK